MKTSEFSIVSKKHEIRTVVQNKISLSAYYDKKFIHANGITSNSYGHYKNNSLRYDQK